MNKQSKTNMTFLLLMLIIILTGLLGWSEGYLQAKGEYHQDLVYYKYKCIEAMEYYTEALIDYKNVCLEDWYKTVEKDGTA